MTKDVANRRLERGGSTLGAHVYTALRDLIVGGEFPPGSRLNEVHLAEMFDVSRGPLREALRKLSNEGLVEIVPHRGAFVPALSLAEVRHLYEYREALEVMVVRLVCERASDEDLAKLRSLLNETQQLLESEPQRGYPEEPDWHRALYQLCGNPLLVTQLTELHTKVRLARSQSSRHHQRAEEAYYEHKTLLEAVLARDVGGAQRAMSEHMRRSLERFRSVTEEG